MTHEELTEILRQHASWLRVEPTGQCADLSGADLRAADLSNANLIRANLIRANLRNANLGGADLRDANLTGADLRWAILDSAALPDGYYHASIAWSRHGERGRRLSAVRSPDGISYSCGCFSGTEQDLRDYIARGEERHRESRLRALRIVIELLEDCK